MTRLLLVRHGESAWNAERRLQGQADPPLTARGERQARDAAALLAPLTIGDVVCSDLARALRTAALLGHPDARRDPRWREIDVGDWSGERIESLRAGDPDRWRDWRAGRLTPPGGEAWVAFRARLADAVADLPRDRGDVLVVTHGSVIRATLALLLDAAPEMLAPVPPGSLSIVETGAWPRLRAYGLTAALDPGPAPD